MDKSITRFLIDMNKLMDGVHIQETTEYDHPRIRCIKFEANLTCPFSEGGMWSPSDAFYAILLDCSKKHFGVENLHDFAWNNTHTVFWIEKEKING